MNFIIKKNQLIFKNIFLYIISFLLILINLKFNSVYASDNKIESNKSRIESVLEENLISKNISFADDFPTSEKDYELYKTTVLDFMDLNQKQTISKTFSPYLNQCLIKFKNVDNPSPEKTAEDILNYLSSIIFSVSIERNQLTYNFFIFGKPFLR